MIGRASTDYYNTITNKRSDERPGGDLGGCSDGRDPLQRRPHDLTALVMAAANAAEAKAGISAAAS